MSQTSYDVVPYVSQVYPQTHVAHLYLLGRLLNLSPPDFRRARILELGCAAGNNIVAMAAGYPEAECLGIDLSETQIRAGQELVAELGLRNVTLRQQAIQDLPEDAGSFDYIICHGIFSWVAPELRERILAIVKRHLAPTGLAVVSYNALPGWTAIQGIRDMMLYHVANFSSPADKVAQARAMLQFIIDAQGEAQSSYRALVESELAFLKTVQDNYFFHDHLEEHNQAFYLHQFAAIAAGQGLAYLGDTDMPSMYLGNYAANVAKLLAGSQDPVRTEQYLDFVNNRRFRSSVVMHQGQTPNRAIDAARIEEFWLWTVLRPERVPTESELPADIELRFTAPPGITFTARNAQTAALFLVLSARGKHPMKVAEVAAEAKRRYRLPQSEEELRRALCEAAVRLFLARALMLRADAGQQVAQISERPAALPLARAQARRGIHVTNGFHETVTLDALGRLMLLALDGTRDRASLVQLVSNEIARGTLKVEHEGQPLSDPATIGKTVEAFVANQLAAFLAHDLLSA
jgi:methyltransferase-like protein/SAM-dependent methyltransferase